MSPPPSCCSPTPYPGVVDPVYIYYLAKYSAHDFDPRDGGLPPTRYRIISHHRTVLGAQAMLSSICRNELAVDKDSGGLWQAFPAANLQEYLEGTDLELVPADEYMVYEIVRTLLKD